MVSRQQDSAPRLVDKLRTLKREAEALPDTLKSQIQVEMEFCAAQGYFVIGTETLSGWAKHYKRPNIEKLLIEWLRSEGLTVENKLDSDYKHETYKVGIIVKW